jgi:outer membrane lipoprotein-sorting protein
MTSLFSLQQSINRRLSVAIAVAALAMSLTSWRSHATEVMDVVLKASAVAYYQGANGKARVVMRIVDAQARERTREFTILRYDVNDQDNGDQKFYVYFHQPADVSKSVFLAWKHVGTEDDRWLYLPALDLVKRISASDARTSFMGSHFYYEDVSGRLPTLDNHVLEEESGPYYVVASTPKNTAAVEFSQYRNWIHKGSHLPVKTEFMDAGGEVYRTYEALKVEVIQGNPTVVEAKMSDTRIGGHTSLTYSGVAYDQDLQEDLFSERYLRSPPRKVLR